MKHLMLALAVAAGALSMPADAAGLRFGEPGFPGTRAPAATTWRHSCAQIQSIVGRNNHAVLTFGRSGWWTGYGTDRVVKDGRFCLTGEGTSPIWVRTSDSAACFAGFTCASGGEFGGRRGR